ncbi:MAG TPA: tryptophan synthase subunit alpha [Thermoanaerobaculia bacterium]|nr:tryptophan synthase subunit alpha [Thermoanaerobaculia bacterium]
MKSSGRVAAAFARAEGEERAAFVAYLTAGDPDLRATVELARAVEAAGADVLELGVPFSDPIADGATLQRAAARALASGTTLDGVFAAAAEIRAKTDLPLLLFSYANPLCARGFGRAFREAASAGFDALLLTDVPAEESDAVLPDVARAGLDPVLLVSPTSDAGRMRAAAERSRGFLYVVSRTGTTGERARLAEDLQRTVARARRAADAERGDRGTLPIAVGFGIASAEDARRVAAIADGVVVGSALVACAESGGARAASAVETLARSLAEACRR